jgi:hydroxymethylpyrimidine/phosphomethylpyrimidine kinase
VEADITRDSSQTPTALTIAGSDSSGGAGLQADLKTFAAHGVFGLSAVTAITAQNTLTVTAIEPLPPALVAAQIAAVAEDFTIGAVKVGMLANAALVEAVAEAIDRHGLGPVVLDTVMVAKSGARLLDPAAVEALGRLLVPRAAVVTPNAPELALLTGRPVTSREALVEAAADLCGRGARAVLAKGGHLEGPAVDVLISGGEPLTLAADRIATRHTHGTGCTLSSAIAARLALGHALADAVRLAKAYVTAAIGRAPGLGRGHGPLGHFPA